MTLLEHLEELRGRLIWIIGSVLLAAVAGWFVYEPVVDRLLAPARPFLTGDKTLIFTGPMEAFTTRFQVAVYVGLAIAFPIVLFHVWRFLSPGFHAKERRFAIPFIVSGTVLFGVGVAFALFTLPEAMRFLIGPAITGSSVRPLLAAKPYVQFGLLYLVAFGLAFEFPVVLMFLTSLRVITSRQMARYRRHVFLGIALVVAFLTPSVDWFSMTVLTVAMYVLYEACIWISKLIRR
jgi:sec-independent protein translocase protein TatC